MPNIVTKVAQIPKLQRKKRVAAYARVSSGKDAMLHSLSAQVSYYNDLIQKENTWELSVYILMKLSPARRKSAPAFSRCWKIAVTEKLI